MLRRKRTNITTVDLQAVAKTVTIKKAVAIIDDVKTAVGNWAEYAAQKKVEESLWKGIAKELDGSLVDGGFGVGLMDGGWWMGFEQRLRETCTQMELSYKFAPQKATTQTS